MSKKSEKTKEIQHPSQRTVELERLADVMFKAEPEPEVKRWFDQYLLDHPEVVKRAADLNNEAAEYTLKDCWLGYYTKASSLRAAELLRQELGHSDASALERLLIEQVVMCHLRLGVVELQYSRALSKDKYSIQVGMFWEQRLTQAHKRFDRATVALARVRRLLQPKQPKMKINAVLLPQTGPPPLVERNVTPPLGIVKDCTNSPDFEQSEEGK